MWSILAGIGGGWAFYYVWRRILPRQRSREFWRAIPAHASGMLHSEDPDDVFRHYRDLIWHIATFGTRNTLAVLAGLVPLAALFLLSESLQDWVPTRDVGLLFDRSEYAFLVGAAVGSIVAGWRSSRARSAPA